MAPLRSLLAASALASLAAATPTKKQASACAEVSASWAAQSPATATPTVGAKLAYDCITSVPFNQSAALALIESVRPYFLWQSTTAYLEDPPAEYVEKVQEPVDVWGGLDEIQAKAEAGAYASEYEFGFALYRLLQSTHDGHFVYIPDSVGEVFNFGRPVALASVSEDGSSLPVPYVYTDVLAETLGNATFKPSPIVEINGQNATEYLLDWAQWGSLQDRDALYNNVFYQLAVVSLGSGGAGMGTFTGGGRGRWVYPGELTELTFANGSSVTYTNFARILTSFTGIASGEDLYRIKFSTPASTSVAPGVSSAEPTATATATAVSSTAAALAAATTIPAPGYPSPVIAQESNLIRGYYIDAAGYEDIAVLAVPSFSGANPGETEFREVAKQFLATARAAGKTKLIVDVSANGGGLILQGYDLFKQLFPSVDAFAAADRFRAFDSTNLIGEKFSAVAETLPRTLDTTNETLAELTDAVVSSIFNYQSDETVDGKPFTSWEEKFGPESYKGDNFTSLIRWNLSDVLTPLNSGGFYITGYEPNKTANLTQPFATENVIVLADGYCASTCTIFSELMRQLVGVKYVSIGGRPIEGITQAVGGVKGTNNYPWSYIQALAQYVFELSTPEEQAYYSGTELSLYFDNTPFLRVAPGTSVNVNFRDGIRKGDETNTPLQFVYEEADCRILYTKEMAVDVTAQWKAVADSAWGTKSACVAGSLAGGNGTYSRSKMVRPRLPLFRKRDLNIADYPLDLYTDLNKFNPDDFGVMMP